MKYFLITLAIASSLFVAEVNAQQAAPTNTAPAAQPAQTPAFKLDCDKMRDQLKNSCAKNNPPNCDKVDGFYQNCTAYKQAMDSCKPKLDDVMHTCNKENMSGSVCTGAKNAYTDCLKSNAPAVAK